MDETPEELAEIKREAERIDPHKYRRRYRVLMTLVALAFCVAVAWVAITMADAGRNPCERVRDYYCKQAGDAAKCDSYHAVYQGIRRGREPQDERRDPRSMRHEDQPPQGGGRDHRRVGDSSRLQTLNEEPQPQVDLTFGLVNLKPEPCTLST